MSSRLFRNRSSEDTDSILPDESEILRDGVLWKRKKHLSRRGSARNLFRQKEKRYVILTDSYLCWYSGNTLTSKPNERPGPGPGPTPEPSNLEEKNRLPLSCIRKIQKDEQRLELHITTGDEDKYTFFFRDSRSLRDWHTALCNLDVFNRQSTTAATHTRNRSLAVITNIDDLKAPDEISDMSKDFRLMSESTNSPVYSTLPRSFYSSNTKNKRPQLQRSSTCRHSPRVNLAGERIKFKAHRRTRSVPPKKSKRKLKKNKTIPPVNRIESAPHFHMDEDMRNKLRRYLPSEFMVAHASELLSSELRRKKRPEIRPESKSDDGPQNEIRAVFPRPPRPPGIKISPQSPKTNNQSPQSQRTSTSVSNSSQSSITSLSRMSSNSQRRSSISLSDLSSLSDNSSVRDLGNCKRLSTENGSDKEFQILEEIARKMVSPQ